MNSEVLSEQQQYRSAANNNKFATAASPVDGKNNFLPPLNVGNLPPQPIQQGSNDGSLSSINSLNSASTPPLSASSSIDEQDLELREMTKKWNQMLTDNGVSIKSPQHAVDFCKLIWTAKLPLIRAAALKIMVASNQSCLLKMSLCKIIKPVRIWIKDAVAAIQQQQSTDAQELNQKVLDQSLALLLVLPVASVDDTVTQLGKVVSQNVVKSEFVSHQMKIKAQAVLDRIVVIAREQQKMTSEQVEIVKQKPTAQVKAQPQVKTTISQRRPASKYTEIDVFNALDIIAGPVKKKARLPTQATSPSAISANGSQQSLHLATKTDSNIATKAVKKAKKSVKWKPDSQLCEYRVFESEDNERSNVSRPQSQLLRDKEREEGAAIRNKYGHQLTGGSGSVKHELSDRVAKALKWFEPPAIARLEVAELVSASRREEQERQRNVLAVFYYCDADIPLSSKEPQEGEGSMVNSAPPADIPLYSSSVVKVSSHSFTNLTRHLQAQIDAQRMVLNITQPQQIYGQQMQQQFGQLAQNMMPNMYVQPQQSQQLFGVQQPQFIYAPTSQPMYAQSQQQQVGNAFFAQQTSQQPYGYAPQQQQAQQSFGSFSMPTNIRKQ